MPSGVLVAVMNFRNWFRQQGIEPPSVIRFRNKDSGTHFAALLEKEVQFAGPKVHWNPNIAYVDIASIRFVWPMPEREGL